MTARWGHVGGYILNEGWHFGLIMLLIQFKISQIPNDPILFFPGGTHR